METNNRMKPLQILRELVHKQWIEKSPLPEHAVPRPVFKQNSANEVTKSICAFIEASGGRADRINVQGQYSEKLGKWIKGNTRKGVADIIACIRGRYVAIEVKFGKDRMSKDQQEYSEAVEAAGGYYFAASDFDSFYYWYESKNNQQ